MHLHHPPPTRPGIVGRIATGLVLTLLAAACGLPGAAQPTVPPTPAAPEVMTTDLPGFYVTDDVPVIDINNHGQIAGLRYVDGEYRTSFWDDGVVTELGLWEARSCVPLQEPGWCGRPRVLINDRGQVGTDIDGHAVLWQEGRFVDIDGDAEWSQLLDLNERGQALVRRFTGEQTILSLWSRGRLQEVAPPPGLLAAAGRLSDAGHVVMQAWDPSSADADGCPFTSYLWQRGQHREIGSLNPTGVNRRGQVIGTACEVVDGTRTSFEALWDDGEMRRLPGLDELADIAGYNPISARHINDRGQIAGYNVVPRTNPGSTRRETVLWEDGEVTAIGLAIGGYNDPAALNERGQVLINGNPEVGDLPGGGSFPSGFLWERGSLVNLAPDDNPAASIHVYEMNERGQIVGYRTDDPFSPRITTLWEVRRPRS